MSNLSVQITSKKTLLYAITNNIFDRVLDKFRKQIIQYNPDIDEYDSICKIVAADINKPVLTTNLKIEHINLFINDNWTIIIIEKEFNNFKKNSKDVRNKQCYSYVHNEIFKSNPRILFIHEDALTLVNNNNLQEMLLKVASMISIVSSADIDWDHILKKLGKIFIAII